MCGDGGFGMLMQEFATSVQHGLPIKVFVFDNRGWGLVHLEMEEAGMPAFKGGVGMRNPDFAMFAQACGGRGLRLVQPGALRATIARALAEPGPVAVDVAVDPAEIPAMPHVELAKVWKFGIVKARELPSPLARRFGAGSASRRFRQLHVHGCVVARRQKLEDLGSANAGDQLARNQYEIDASRIEALGATVKPRVRLSGRMELTPDVDEAFVGDACVELASGARVRFLRSQARVGVLSGAGDVPVAGHDHGAFPHESVRRLPQCRVL
jgi:hypothetical protein